MTTKSTSNRSDGGPPKENTGPASARSAQRSKTSNTSRHVRAKRAQRERKRTLWIRSLIVVVAAVVALVAVFLLSNHGGKSNFAFSVGSPGPGATAPTFDLPSTNGGTFNLAATRGKTTLVFFQEGIDCEPCWTQLQDIQRDLSKFHAAGISQVVSITTDGLGALKQKASDEGLHVAVLSDQNLKTSHAYDTTGFGMMGPMVDGHSFIVIGPSGKIEWRADYGGAPNYTMFVPDAVLLEQMRTGLAHQKGVAS
ncbi:MAG TPA: redoxin domain-containing protein [Acidimicrobiales bacterium]